MFPAIEAGFASGTEAVRQSLVVETGGIRALGYLEYDSVGRFAEIIHSTDAKRERTPEIVVELRAPVQVDGSFVEFISTILELHLAGLETPMVLAVQKIGPIGCVEQIVGVYRLVETMMEGILQIFVDVPVDPEINVIAVESIGVIACGLDAVSGVKPDINVLGCCRMQKPKTYDGSE